MSHHKERRACPGKGFLYFSLTSLVLLTMLSCERSGPDQATPPAGETLSAGNVISSTQTNVPEITETQAVLPEGDSLHTLVFDGLERSYVLHIPPGFDDNQPVPLVIAFHGLTLDAEEMIRISGFNAQSDASGFVIVYPNGSGENQSWNGGHCCGMAALDEVDDIGFTRLLISELGKVINIDPQRIYATGFSNGAVMTYLVACDLADIIAAVGPVSATQIQDDMQACEPARPVPLIHFHGTADEANPYNGAVTQAGFEFLSVSTEIQFWVGFNGCPAEPVTSVAGSITHEVYSPCDAGADVELYTIADGMHAWPGGEAVNLRMGEPTQEISATLLMWEFFIAHPLP